MSEMTFVARNTFLFRLVILTQGRMPELTSGFLQNLNGHCFALLSEVLSSLLPDPLEDCLSLSVNLHCLRLGCRRRRSSFSSLVFAPLFPEAIEALPVRLEVLHGDLHSLRLVPALQ